METTEILLQLKGEIAELKKLMLLSNSRCIVSDKWLTRGQVKDFLNYGDTQMAEFEKQDGILVTRVGRRKFIHRDSLEKFLDNNKSTS